jgi:hypothetical protein
MFVCLAIFEVVELDLFVGDIGLAGAPEDGAAVDDDFEVVLFCVVGGDYHQFCREFC